MIKRLRNMFVLILVSLGITFMPVSVALAQTDILKPVCNRAGDAPAVCKDNATGSSSSPILGPEGIMTKAVQLLVMILGIVAVFTVVIAGLRIVVSNGDSNTIATMQKAIIAALAGLAVAAIAQAIVTFLLSKL